MPLVRRTVKLSDAEGDTVLLVYSKTSKVCTIVGTATFEHDIGYVFREGDGRFCIRTPPRDTGVSINAVAEAISFINEQECLEKGLILEVQAVATFVVNRPLAGCPTCDAVTLKPGDALLLTAEVEAKDNGVWLVGFGEWRRPEAKCRVTHVLSGLCHGDTYWIRYREVIVRSIRESALAMAEKDRKKVAG